MGDYMRLPQPIQRVYDSIEDLSKKDFITETAGDNALGYVGGRLYKKSSFIYKFLKLFDFGNQKHDNVILLRDIEQTVPGRDTRNYSYLVSELFTPLVSNLFGKQGQQVANIPERAQYLSDRVFEQTVKTICKDGVQTLSDEDFVQFIHTIMTTGGCHRNLSILEGLIYRGHAIGHPPVLSDPERNERLQKAVDCALEKIVRQLDMLDATESEHLRHMLDTLCLRNEGLTDDRRLAWYGILTSGIDGSLSTFERHELVREYLFKNALALKLSGSEELFATLKTDMAEVPAEKRQLWLKALGSLHSFFGYSLDKERVQQIRGILHNLSETSAPPVPEEVASAPPMPEEEASAPLMPDDWLAPAKDLEPSRSTAEPNVVVLESAPEEIVQAPLSAAQEKLYDDICAELRLEDAISNEVFFDPVVTADGQTYENSSITDWLTRNRRSPLTNQELPHTTLVRNVLLKNVMNAIRQHVSEHEDATQDSVKAAILPLLSYQDPVIALETKGGFEMGHTYERSAIEAAQERPEVAPNWKVKELLGTP